MNLCIGLILGVLLLITPLVEQGYYHRTILDSTAFEQKMEQLKKPKYREVLAEISYYTSAADECGKSNGITASGTQATEGRTIAMSQEIPFGTKVIIDGFEYTVEDRGGAITGNCVDVYVQDKSTAYQKGRQWKVIKILEE